MAADKFYRVYYIKNRLMFQPNLVKNQPVCLTRVMKYYTLKAQLFVNQFFLVDLTNKIDINLNSGSSISTAGGVEWMR